MAFWGIEIKPGNPVTHSFDRVRRRLRISQATLGIGSVMKKVLVQCNVGNKYPVFLCALLPDKTESCHLDLEFEEQDDVVFSVIGPRSVYLTGYYVSDSRHPGLGSDTETYGEDIANTESEESKCQTDEDSFDDSFIDDDDDLEVFPPSPVSSDKADEDMPDKNNMTECKVIRKPRRKRTQVIDSDDSTSWQSEEEDNFILSVLKKDVRTTVSEVAEKNGQEKGGKTEDGATSDGVSDKAPDGLLMHREAERKNLQDNVLVPSNEVKSDKEIEPMRSWEGPTKEAETLEDNFVNHNDGPVDGKSQVKNEKVDNSENLVVHDEDKSEPGPVSKKKSKRKRRDKSHEVNEKAIKEDESLQIVAVADSKSQEPLQSDKDAQRPTIQGDSSLFLPPAEISENHQNPKKRRKGGTGERSLGSNDGTCDDDLVGDHFKQQELEGSKMNEDLPATTEECWIPTDRASDPVAEGCKLKKAKRKKKKDNACEIDANLNTGSSILSENENINSPMKLEERNDETETSKTRTLSNGLTIEELTPGEKDGKVATVGRKVKVFYTAKLRDNGHVFDSNIGKSAYKFRLGDETIIDGWNIGLEGMRVGGKRRLIIPPSMGFGLQGGGENIPPNSWLVYEVELAGAR